MRIPAVSSPRAVALVRALTLAALTTATLGVRAADPPALVETGGARSTSIQLNADITKITCSPAAVTTPSSPDLDDCMANVRVPRCPVRIVAERPSSGCPAPVEQTPPTLRGVVIYGPERICESTNLLNRYGKDCAGTRLNAVTDIAR